MKLRKINLLMASFSLLALSACSTTGNKNPTISYPASASSSEAATQGLGANATIGGLNTSASPYRMKAPYNQIYFFDFNQSMIKADDLGSIDVQGNYLAAHPQSRILLTGNTDERGSREYNIALGNRRAITVENRLKTDGAAQRQINEVSFGAEKPISPGNTEEDYAQNRNVQLIYKEK